MSTTLAGGGFFLLYPMAMEQYVVNFSETCCRWFGAGPSVSSAERAGLTLVTEHHGLSCTGGLVVPRPGRRDMPNPRPGVAMVWL